MRAPQGTSEYQKELTASKSQLNRLKVGLKKLEEAMKEKDTVKANQVMDLWYEIAKDTFTRLELVTLIHQHHATGNKVLLHSDGTYVKIDELADPDNPENLEMDPWLLHSLEKLKTVFGDEIKDVLEIKEDGPPN